MDYVGISEKDQQEMLKAIGVDSVLELYSAVPKELMQPLVKEDGLSEREAWEKIVALGKKNKFSDFTSYLGGGAYDHYIPAVVAPILSKSEFLTSYTPYQPELSQGMLQVLFEFQTAICRLTGMEVANASLYDGATSAAEALLLALRHGKGKKILVDSNLNPRYQSVINLYGIETMPLCLGDIDRDTAAVLVSYPNYFGEMVDPRGYFQKAKEMGALSVLVANPLVFGLFSTAGELGADISVGDGQPLGLPLQFGGPYVGYFAAKKELIRELPGRIVGETVDRHGKRCYVLTLQAREQHIRREKAKSNICTSQSLAAMAMLLTLLWYGPQGLPKLALENYQKANELKSRLLKIPGFSTPSSLPTFNEFVILFPLPIDEIFPLFEREKIIPGLKLDSHSLLIVVTEKKTEADLKKFLALSLKLTKR
jgi:glycine dehydrogenase subunit 1